MTQSLNTIMERKSLLKKQAGLKDFIRDFANHELDTLTLDQLLEVANAIDGLKKEPSVLPLSSENLQAIGVAIHDTL